MSLIITFLYLVFIMASITLVVVILLQEGKGGGFGAALGTAGQQAFGVKATGVQKFTAYVAIVFIGSAIAIHLLNQRRGQASSLRGQESSLSGDEESGALELLPEGFTLPELD